MPFMVSPGINVSELDLTASTQQVSVSDAAFAGPFQWGPALVPVTIGSEDELVRTFGKPDDTIASYWFCAQSFLAYSNLLHVVRAVGNAALNATTTAKAITGNVVVTSGNSTVVNASASFSNAGLKVGQRIVLANSTANVVFTVASLPANTSELVVTPTPSATMDECSVTAYGVLISNEESYENSLSGLTGHGAWAAKYPGELGNSLRVSVCPSANAFAKAATGTQIALEAGNTSVAGIGTKFDEELGVGDFIVVGGTKHKVATITSNTALVLATAPAANATPQNGAFSYRWEFADLFDRAPGTSPFATAREASGDELHVVVVDSGGKFTGVAGTVLERFPFLSKASDGKNSNGETSYYKDTISNQSKYVYWLSHPGTVTTNWGSEAQGLAFGGDIIATRSTLYGGVSGNAGVSDGELQIAYDEFKNGNQIDISLVICGPVNATVASYIIQNICEARADCVAFVSPTRTSVVNNPGSEVSSLTTFRNSLPSSSYALLDSGWKYQYDKYNDKFRWVPLCGDTAGLAARTDTVSDPWFSPAGFSRGNIKNVVKLAWNPKQLDRDEIYKLGINPVVSFPGQGVVLYGDKTLLNRPSAFDRINVRRLFIILEKTIARLSRSQLFEFNDEFTRSMFRNAVEPFLRDVQARRGLVDYRVICDDTNNTAEVIAQNRFVGDIFVKPSLSINYIQLNFVAVRSGVSFQEVTGA